MAQPTHRVSHVAPFFLGDVIERIFPVGPCQARAHKRTINVRPPRPAFAGKPREAHPSFWAPFVLVGEGAGLFCCLRYIGERFYALVRGCSKVDQRRQK